MKKLVLFLSVVFFLSFQVYAQDATVSVPDITADPDTEVLVPVSVTALNNVGSTSINVLYDQSVLTYIGIENNVLSGFFLDNDLGGELRTSWFDLSPVDLDGKIFDIRFQYTGGSSDLELVVELTDNLSQPYDIAIDNGSIGGAVASISLTAPNGGEEWEIGSAQSITWNSSSIDNVKIEYTTDNGSSWNDVVASTPNTGSYSWTIPDAPTDQAKVFVSDASDIGVNDESDAVFSIVTPPSPPVVGDIPDQTINEGESFATINLDDYVTDADNDASEMSWAATGQAELTVTITDRVATITYPDQWGGSEIVTFTATDPDMLSDSDDATFTVNAVNNPPVVSGIPDQTVNEGENFATVNLDDYVDDPDNDASEMTWAATGQSDLSVSISNRVATITYPDQWSGNETITFTATDPGGESDSDDAMYTVNAVNNPPVVEGIPDQTIDDGDSFATINLDDFVTDPDNDAAEMTWAATGQSDLTVTITDRVATIEYSSGWTGNETITFTATDPGGESDSDDATFTVEPVVGLEDDLSSVPDEFSLNQNYPNPFNPSTAISYGLKVQSDVTLNVYNMVGEEMASLVDESKNAGMYIVNFDASNLSTGVYFYTLTAVGIDGTKFVNTRKMILMK